MTVAELREKLSMFPDDLEIFFCYDYGDHWHTTVAESVTCLSAQEIKYSDYHQMHKIVNDDDEDCCDDESVKKVIIIN